MKKKERIVVGNGVPTNPVIWEMKVGLGMKAPLSPSHPQDSAWERLRWGLGP